MPPALLLWLVLFCWFFLIYLLNFVLDRWWPDVVSLSRVLQLTVFSRADVVSFGARNVSSHMPAAPTLAPWWTIERTRGTWKHKKGDLGVRAWISFDFGWISGPHVRKLLANFGAKYVCFCHACFQVMFLNDFGVWIWIFSALTSSLYYETKFPYSRTTCFLTGTELFILWNVGASLFSMGTVFL